MYSDSPNPTVSVVVITYNQEKYIRQTIEGILNQECDFSIEVIIGEDCSTDNTRKICIDLQKEYPQTIRLELNPVNWGVVRNYTNALSKTRGKYIAECAGDDYWVDPLKLQKEVDILEQNEDVALVHTAWKILDEDTGIEYDKPSKIKPYLKNHRVTQDFSTVLLNQHSGAFVHLCTACFRKVYVDDILKKYPEFFDGSKCKYEDYQLTFFLLQYGSFYFLDDVTLMYRERTNSVSNSIDLCKHGQYLFNMVQLRFDIIHLYKYKTEDAKPYLDHISSELFFLAFKIKDVGFADQVKELFSQNAYEISLRNRLIYSITSHSIIREPSHLIFRFIRKIKERISPSLSKR